MEAQGYHARGNIVEIPVSLLEVSDALKSDRPSTIRSAGIADILQGHSEQETVVSGEIPELHSTPGIKRFVRFEYELYSSPKA